jgi:hypothetical protein
LDYLQYPYLKHVMPWIGDKIGLYYMCFFKINKFQAIELGKVQKKKTIVWAEELINGIFSFINRNFV